MRSFSLFSCNLWALSVWLFSTLAHSQIIITEVMHNPSKVDDAVGEWFEVLNSGDTAVNMQNWTILGSLATETFTVNTALIVAPRAYAVFGVNANSSVNGNIPVNFTFRGTTTGFQMTNGVNDRIIIRNSAGVEVDRIDYNGLNNNGTWPNSEGGSMSLRGVALDNNNGTNWCKSAPRPEANTDPATPGAANLCEGAAPPVDNSTVAPVAVTAAPAPAPTPTTDNACTAFQNQCTGFFREGVRIHFNLGGFCVSKCHKSFLLNLILRLGWRCGDCGST